MSTREMPCEALPLFELFATLGTIMPLDDTDFMHVREVTRILELGTLFPSKSVFGAKKTREIDVFFNISALRRS